MRRRGESYQVRDVNKACALSLPSALLEVLGSGLGSARHGLRVARDLAVTRATESLPDGTAFSPAAQCPCLAEAQCRARASHCRWLQRTCAPKRGARGFEGVLPFAGQVAEAGRRARGDYGPETSGQKWRVPRRLPAVTREQQELAWKLPALGGQAPAGVVATVLRHLDKASLQKHREATRKDLGEKAPLGDEVLRGLLWERLKDSHDLTKLPVPLREFALETERRRSQALARPWWKRGIPTSARNSLKRAVARHAAAGQSNDELLRLLANDARVGQEARDARGGLSTKTMSYVSGLVDHGGRG